MITTRRELLLLVLGTAVAGQSKRTVRLGLLLPLEPGVELGVEEARRMAELVGVNLDVRNEGTGVAAAISRHAAKEPGSPLGSPLLIVGPVEEGSIVHPRVFHVASSPRRRREALAAAPAGARAVDWHPDLARYGAEQLNRRFEERFDLPMTEDAWRGWMAVKIAAEAALCHPEADLAQVLPTMRFDGHKGAALRFGPEDHHLDQPVYLAGPDGKLLPGD